jgi:hypothetical protein
VPSAASAAILRDLKLHEHLFDLTRDDLGEQLLDIAGEAMLRNLDAELDADGAPLAPLSEGYGQWKAKAAPGRPIGELYGELKDPANFEGERRITPEVAISVFGVTQEARDEAAAFIEGNDRQPPRNFHGLTIEALQLSDEALDRRFAEVG